MKKGPTPASTADVRTEGRERMEMDVDRMVNEGLAGGRVTPDAGRIGETTVHTMDDLE